MSCRRDEPVNQGSDEDHLRDALQGMSPLGCFYAITIALTQKMSLPLRGIFSTDEKCLRDILQPTSPLRLPDWIMALPRIAVRGLPAASVRGACARFRC